MKENWETHPNFLRHRRAVKGRMLREMKFDFVNGCTKTEILENFLEGKYAVDEDAPTSYDTFNRYWKEMTEKFGEDLAERKEVLKTMFFEKYNDLYKRNLKKDNLKCAKDIIDSLVKLTGCDAPEKKEITLDGTVDISFGFDEN